MSGQFYLSCKIYISDKIYLSSKIYLSRKTCLTINEHVKYLQATPLPPAPLAIVEWKKERTKGLWWCFLEDLEAGTRAWSLTIAQEASVHFQDCFAILFVVRHSFPKRRQVAVSGASSEDCWALCGVHFQDCFANLIVVRQICVYGLASHILFLWLFAWAFI